MKKCYISGVISNGGTLPKEMIEHNLRKFFQCEDWLIRQGIHVINPARYPKDLGSWKDYMLKSISDLFDCDMLCRLSGYTTSKGAMIELSIAHSLGLEVIDYW